MSYLRLLFVFEVTWYLPDRAHMYAPYILCVLRRYSMYVCMYVCMYVPLHTYIYNYAVYNYASEREELIVRSYVRTYVLYVC